jgi:hypothetical protein
LQTEIADPDSIVSISANQFTLAAGTYLIRWYLPAYLVGGTQSRLYNATDAAEVEVGTNAQGDDNQGGGSARTTIAGSKAFSIEHQSSGTRATDGLGNECNFGTEQYTVVEIFKEA